ncbi:MAG: PTS sugar transporter subunit IIC [Gemmatimonadales bacterium]
MSDLPLLALFLWGTVAGLDQASVLQGLLSRPLVTGAVSGAIVGDLESGLRIGAVLELFALDVLPVGASRYPDFGAATVAAVALGAGETWELALGPSVLLGLLYASAAGWTLVVQRRVTAWALRRHQAELDRGDPGVARRVHGIGLGAELGRSALVSALALLSAALVAGAPRLDVPTGRALALVVVVGGLAAVTGGALRRAGTMRRFGWLLGGALAGLAGAMLR